MLIPSLKDYVYQFITDSIQKGTLKANDKINEADIVKVLNVSRTPIREALIQLEADGFLKSYPRKGFFIKPITEQEAKDLYAVIGQLDAFAAELAIKNLDASDFEKLNSLHQLMQASIDSHNYRQYYEFQIDFHNVYINKSNNPTLIDTLNRLRRRFIRQSYGDNNDEEFSDYLRCANEQHKQIITLLNEGNIKKLRELLIFEHWALHYAELDSF